MSEILSLSDNFILEFHRVWNANGEMIYNNKTRKELVSCNIKGIRIF
jgi:hypothetical protein